MWPKAGLAAAIVALGMAVGVGLGSLLPDDAPASAPEPVETAAECPDGGDTLDIAADQAVVAIVQELADQYTSDVSGSGRDCMPIEVRGVSSSAVVGRLSNGWRTATHGPRPDVWIPKSTLWVELLREDIGDSGILPEDPTVLARSPTVMAVPKPMAEELGWPDARLGWNDFYELADDDAGWGAVGKPGWGRFRLDLTDPRYTTTGLQALLALDQAVGDAATLESGTPLSLFSVQRVASNIDASSTETLERFADADAPLRSMSATPLEEREVCRFNETGSPEPGPSPAASEAAGDADGGQDPQLVAMYPRTDADIAMESDYPYVLLDASWVSSDILQLADEFGDYLLSQDGQAMFADAGFRTRDNEAMAVGDGECAAARDQVAAAPPGDLPDVGAFRALRTSWVAVPRVSRTLLLVDVSGSMVVEVPGTGRTRLQATVDAARKSLEVIPNAGAVGLWEFSTDLPDGRNGGDYRELVSLGPLNEVVGGRERKQRIADELDGLVPRNDTALNDTVVAAYRTMRQQYEPGSQHTIVLLTDGRNDDDNSISHQQMLRQLRLQRKPGQPIDVVSIAFGEDPDLEKLAEISDEVGGRVIASPKQRGLDRKFIEALRR